jgi:hypothetical protein
MWPMRRITQSIESGIQRSPLGRTSRRFDATRQQSFRRNVNEKARFADTDEDEGGNMQFFNRRKA